MSVYDQLDNLLEESPGGDFLEIFDTYSPTDNTSVYNAGCWITATDFTGVSFSELSATLISPRHATSCWHGGGMGAVDGQSTWIAADGTRYVRTLLGKTEILNWSGGGTDIQVGYFGLPGFDGDDVATDPDLPASLARYKVLPRAFLDYLPLFPTEERRNPEEGVIAERPPFVSLNQYRQAFVREAFWVRTFGGLALNVVHYDSSQLPWLPAWQFTYSGNRGAYSLAVVIGDSGKPSFVLLGGELVLFGHHGSEIAFTLPAYYAPEINAAMLQLEADNGGSDGYQLQTIALGQPMRVAARQVHAAGSLQSQIHAAGIVKGEVHAAGIVKGEVHAAGSIQDQTHAAGSVRSQVA